MTCGEFEELSGAYALDAVTPAERLAAEAHLATCARCTRLFQETRGVVSLLPLSVPQIPPPPSLQGRILSVIRDESNSITGQPTQPRGDASVPSPRPHLSRPYGERTRRGGGGRDEGRGRSRSFRDAFCSMPQQAQKHPAKAGCGDAINRVPTPRWGPALAHIELSQSPDGFRFVGHAPAEHLAELVRRLPLTRR